MARRARTGAVTEPSVELTPMIDVVFLLLVFFILSAKFIRDESQLATSLPDQGGPGLPTPPIPTATSGWKPW